MSKDWTQEIAFEVLEGEITRLTARVKELEAALREMKEMAEYWINLAAEPQMTKERYDTWLALGHHSKAMSLTRAALTRPAKEKGE